ncbi:hypothetical protein FIE12Z_1400 [Fusarium flagelliforme]|uniref:Uncharacterized protein n=1 Tax=Fusarium flagelliforme TaxID=2675880 RepID=A0A395N2E0_9HYPO|nr:hypothetical protein FIE12Z_1400 [Fusarium flagelliforme]
MSSTDQYPQGEIFSKMFSPVQDPEGDESSDIKTVSEHHSEQEHVESQSHYEPLGDETRKYMSEKKRENLKRKRAKGFKPEYINKKKDDRAKRKEDAKQEKAEANDMELFRLYASNCYDNGVADTMDMDG